MPISLRLTEEKEKAIKIRALKEGKTKTRYILDVIDEKLGMVQDREQLIKKSAGWLTHKEAEELRQSLSIFESVDEEDWK